MINPEITKLKEQAILLEAQSRLLMDSVNFTVGLIGSGEIENEEQLRENITYMGRLKTDYEALIRMEEEYERIRIRLNELDGNKEVLKKLDSLPPLDFTLD